jgi:indolepyruvate ferredoxin oxidoreductase
MSQKNGAVTSHVRISAQPGTIHAQRIATGEANLILGCDMLTAGAQDAIAKTRPGVTVAVINLREQPAGQFAQNRDWQFPAAQIRALIDEAVDQRAHYVDATQLATALLGDAIASNLFMLGFAFQKGLVPLSEAALLRAIELNAVAVEANKAAFLWGRRAAADLQAVERVALPARPVAVQLPQSLEAIVAKRVAALTAYQNAAYGQRYAGLVEQVHQAEASLGKGDAFTKAVARNLYKLMAYKDEYEVARLYSDGHFAERLASTFEGDFKLTFHLAPPLLAKRDAQGRLVKARYGSWMWQAFGLLARLRFLRGTALDVFGRTEERRLERQLIADYEATIAALLPRLRADNLVRAAELANLPDQIRGFGHVKLESIGKVRARWKALEDELQGRAPAPAVVEPPARPLHAA